MLWGLRGPVPQEDFVANGGSLSEQRLDLVKHSKIDARLTSLQSRHDFPA
jgi:hypothetical protein